MATDPSSSQGAEPSFNLEEALHHVEGDCDLLAEIAGIFLSDAPAMVVDVVAAIASGDAEAVSRAAHRLKGSVLIFGAPGAAAAALRLETTGRAGDLSTADDDAAHLRAEVDRLCEGLEGLVREQPKRAPRRPEA